MLEHTQIDCIQDVTELLDKYPAFSGEIQSLLAKVAALHQLYAELYREWIELGRKVGLEAEARDAYVN